MPFLIKLIFSAPFFWVIIFPSCFLYPEYCFLPSIPAPVERFLFFRGSGQFLFSAPQIALKWICFFRWVFFRFSFHFVFPVYPDEFIFDVIFSVPLSPVVFCPGFSGTPLPYSSGTFPPERKYPGSPGICQRQSFYLPTLYRCESYSENKIFSIYKLSSYLFSRLYLPLGYFDRI